MIVSNLSLHRRLPNPKSPPRFLITTIPRRQLTLARIPRTRSIPCVIKTRSSLTTRALNREFLRPLPSLDIRIAFDNGRYALMFPNIGPQSKRLASSTAFAPDVAWTAGCWPGVGVAASGGAAEEFGTEKEVAKERADRG